MFVKVESRDLYEQGWIIIGRKRRDAKVATRKPMSHAHRILQVSISGTEIRQDSHNDSA